MTADELAAAVTKAVPESLTAHEDGLDMPTLTVKGAKLLEVATYLRDKQGKNFLSAVTAVDHLGYGEERERGDAFREPDRAPVDRCEHEAVEQPLLAFRHERATEAQ